MPDSSTRFLGPRRQLPSAAGGWRFVLERLVVVATALACIGGDGVWVASQDQGANAPFGNVYYLANCPIGDGYWEQVRIAGIETASVSLNEERTHCLETEEEVKEVIDTILAERPPEGRTALIIGNVGLPGEKHFARAIREGLYVFLIGKGIDVAQYNLDLSKHFVVALEPDNAYGGQLIGKELCRIGGDKFHRAALLYGPDPSTNIRLDNALEAFRTECPSSSLAVVHNETGDWSVANAQSIFASLFVKDSTITTVLCANDAMAEGVIIAADRMLPTSDATRLLISGFDDNENQRKYIRSSRIFATVNLGTTVANAKLWSTVPKLMWIIQRNDISTTTDLQSSLSMGGMNISTGVALAAADEEGYLLASIEKAYMSNVRAPSYSGGPTVVTVGVFDVRIEKINMDEGSYTATFWILLSWTDPRLAWNPVYFNGTLQRDHGNLWEPYVYVNNMLSSETLSDIGKSPLTVSSDGAVNTALKITSDFGCDMNLLPYPYDIHKCSIDISVASDAKLVALVNGTEQGDIAGMPESFICQHLESSLEYTSDNPSKINQTTVHFFIEFKRQPGYIQSTFLLIAYALNLVSFLAFWITPVEGNMDRSGLGITTILANFFLQSDGRSSKITTWLDIFFMISTAFQFITFFISVVAAHYAFDPDYASEYDMLKEFSEKTNVASVASAFTGDNKIKSYTPAEQLHRLVDSLLGDAKDMMPDRIGRRVVVPVFLIVMMALPFLPTKGDMSLSKHPETGVKSPLFHLSLTFFLFWLAAVIAKISLKSAGVVAAGHNYDARKRAMMKARKQLVAAVKHGSVVRPPKNKDSSFAKVVNAVKLSRVHSAFSTDIGGGDDDDGASSEISAERKIGWSDLV